MLDNDQVFEIFNLLLSHFHSNYPGECESSSRNPGRGRQLHREQSGSSDFELRCNCDLSNFAPYRTYQQEPGFYENEYIYDDIEGLEEMLLDVRIFLFYRSGVY